MSLQEPNFPTEMGNIPYDEIVGGPLNAAVAANTSASQQAAAFIRDVAFEPADDFTSFSDAQKPRYVEFFYKKQVSDDEGTVSEREFKMRVPLLLLLHVPYFEVEKVTVDFNVKLNSVRKRAITEDTSGSAGFEFGDWLPPVFNVSGSYKRTDKRAQTVERTYDQSVHVEAGSIEPPEGVTRLLDVLEQTITEEGGDDGSDTDSDDE